MPNRTFSGTLENASLAELFELNQEQTGKMKRNILRSNENQAQCQTILHINMIISIFEAGHFVA